MRQFSRRFRNSGIAVAGVIALAVGGFSASQAVRAQAPQSGAGTSQQSSVSQYGITWSFDGEQPVGRFANGDWWVVGPVTLTGITPASTADEHGEYVNPEKGDVNFDACLGSPVHRLSFPLEVEPGSSIVKGASLPAPCYDDDNDPDREHRGELRTAAVLTVVDEPPPDNGATVFRPPYFGDDKPYYSTNALRTDLLPSLAPPDDVNVGPLDEVAETFARVQLDHSGGNEDNRRLHPFENLKDYGAWYAQDTNHAALRLMLDDPIADKEQALVNYVQAGIDLLAVFEHDSGICSDADDHSCAGHGPGRTIVMAFAATMLDSPELQASLDGAAERDMLTENWSVRRTDNAPTVLFGDVPCTEDLYWQVLGDSDPTGPDAEPGPGPQSCQDPYGYIDGGYVPGDWYDNCCMAQPWKGSVTAQHLMPELKQSWPESDELIEYVDRWVDFGAWTQPDPDPKRSNWFADLHGHFADDGSYRTPLADALWTEHDLSDEVTIDWDNL